MVRPLKLDDQQRRTFCALVSVGLSQRKAARHLGFSSGAIRHLAGRDPQFAEMLRSATTNCELSHLQNIRDAGKRSWRKRLVPRTRAPSRLRTTPPANLHRRRHPHLPRSPRQHHRHRHSHRRRTPRRSLTHQATLLHPETHAASRNQTPPEVTTTTTEGSTKNRLGLLSRRVHATVSGLWTTRLSGFETRRLAGG